MTIQQLLFFEEACRSGSLSKAAGKLFISQQGLSAAISSLEKELGCPLLVRGPKGVTPTEDGRFLLSQADVILEADRACTRYFAARRPVQVLRVACAFGALSEFADAALSRFTEQNPNIRLEITEYTDNLCDDAVRSGAADVGLSVLPVDTAQFSAVPLFSSKMCLLVHRSNPLAEKAAVSLAELNGVKMVIPDGSFKSPAVFLDHCAALGVRPDIRRRVGEIFTVHRLVLSHPTYVGLSVVSVVRSDNNPDLVLLPFADHAQDWVVCLIRRKGEGGAAIEALEKSLLADTAQFR